MQDKKVVKMLSDLSCKPTNPSFVLMLNNGKENIDLISAAALSKPDGS